jgi:trimeric autotransporter adhesin
MTTPSTLRISCVLCALLPSTLAVAETLSPITFNDNTFLGVNTGNEYMSILALDNTALGSNAFSLNVVGAENTALGSNALWRNFSGFRNTAVGYVALANNFDGMDNVALGHSAMYRNESGNWNIAIGLQALYHNSTGNNNVAIGRDANFSNTTGNWNTGVGVDAIPGVETGHGNTGVGGESGYTEDMANQNVTGSYNTWIGYQSGPSSPAQHDGVIGIGYRSKTSKDYQAVLGSPAIVETLLFGRVGINATDPSATLVVNGDAVNLTGVWGVYSDERLKQDVQPYRDGLEAVRRLEPVTFHYNGHEGLSGDGAQVGLIAQQVEKVAPYMVSQRKGADFDDVRVLSTQALPYMLVNAIQELEAKVVELERRLAAAESRAGASDTRP